MHVALSLLIVIIPKIILHVYFLYELHTRFPGEVTHLFHNV